QHRPLDDKRYALDHFQTKLLKLPQTMQTARGKQLAQQMRLKFIIKMAINWICTARWLVSAF
ncbi:hypothetical protein AB0U24_22175, partial [Escherichia coli]